MKYEIRDLHEEHVLDRKEKLIFWAEGPWVEEPDEVSFVYREMKCLIMRKYFIEGKNHMFGGHLCGYVKIPTSNILYKLDLSECQSKVEAYNGVSFSGKLAGKRGWYVGFHCAHTPVDIVPSFQKIYGDLLKQFNRLPRGIYKTVEFCIEECKKLVDNLRKL